MRTCPACHSRSLPSFGLLLRNYVTCSQCQARVTLRRTVVVSALFFAWPLFAVGLPAGFHSLPKALRVATSVTCILTVCVLLIRFAPVERYRLGFPGFDGKAASPVFWMFIVGAILCTVVLISFFRDN